MQRLIWLIGLGIFLLASSTVATPLTKAQVPEPLKPWIDWVLEAHPEQACPFIYNSYEQKRCSWPTETRLELTPKKGLFSLRWRAHAESWLTLPGDNLHWPLNVTINNKPALVMDRDGLPSVKLTPPLLPSAFLSAARATDYQVNGEFLWDNIPDNLAIPADTGLVNLTLNGLTIPMPTLRDGQLWLKASELGQGKPENVQNHVDVQVFRKVTDEVPLQVLTRLLVEVSGEQREIKLAKPILDGFIVQAIQSPLPARLEPDGQLLLQVRPGRWEIDVTARNSKAADALPLPIMPAAPGPVEHWPPAEIWVFDARPDLRVVDVEGLNALDASQTNLPEEWKDLPAYSISQGQAMGFKVIRRGDPNPEPNQLDLNRKLWLDFDGAGYTVNDVMTGKMSSGWRLNALPQTQPGKLTLDGGNQLITREAGTGRQGVEVRKGIITLDADSRITGPVGTLSAVGWEQNFHNVHAELNLPPGWRLLAAGGVDNVPDSWISRWTLLDLFLVLIAGLATARIWNAYWGGFALLTLIIIWHEPGSPHFVWLNILAATALINVLTGHGTVLKFICAYRNACWLVLLMIAIPFMVDQVRMGLYPQLETPDFPEYPASDAVTMTAPQSAMQTEMADAPVATPRSAAKLKGYAYGVAENLAAMADKPVNFDRIDPSAHVQTGPGLPQWRWHKVLLSWNGSVDAGQQLRLWYMSPAMTMLLNFIRVLSVAVLALLMFGVADKFKPGGFRFRSSTPLLLWFLLLPLASLPAKQAYAEYPNEQLLTELKNRLQEVATPDCLPTCAQIQQMSVKMTEKTIDILLQIHAQEAVTLPLPSDYGQWFPNQVLDNGTPAAALYRENQGLWISLQAGEHQVVLRGVTPLLGKFTLPLPLKPKHAAIEKTGWEVIGIHENGLLDDTLQFSRINQTATDKPALAPGVLPPFVRVERTLQLGLDWRVSTRIVRLSPPGSAIVLSVPLLPGEAVTSAGVRVKEGRVDVNMSAQQDLMQWESVLAKTETLALTAAQTEHWIEVWRADISPVWHLETTGIAMIRLDNTAQWLPEWHPWPGEEVVLQITRPEAVPGQTLTIDNSALTIKPGQRIRDAELTFSLRSSQGTQHTLTLPEHAVLQSVAIDGQSQPIRLQGRKLSLPINPGSQELSINWQETVPVATVMTTPTVDLGQNSVNSHVNVRLGEDRWVLFAWGPRLGPAVLFWGMLIVIFLLSLGLGRIRLTPLKSWQWFLLLVGLSQIPLEMAGIVVVWLVVLGWRKQRPPGQRYFNPLQVAVGVLTLAALGVLFFAVAEGLLDTPDMRITGNESSAFNLNWYQDRSLSVLPTATLVSVPLIVYRLLMLAWSLWLAIALLDWLKWGWGCFATNGLWHKKAVPLAAIDDAKTGS
ncbi:MAG: hypothetical protein Q7U57_15605 [Methylovulum sp.]|nr:hypothetical protein [Methylovulum sp.]